MQVACPHLHRSQSGAGSTTDTGERCTDASSVRASARDQSAYAVGYPGTGGPPVRADKDEEYYKKSYAIVSSNQTVTQKAMKWYDSSEAPGNVLYGAMVVGFLVDVKSLKPYHTVHSLEQH